jgi:predicted RNA-binding Zn-ribbon protein involved in translation (DUF1610 family)
LGGSSITIARYRRFARLGFALDPNHLERSYLGYYYTGYRIYIPHWMMLLLMLIPIGAVIRRKHQRRRLENEGRCLACGYDLRATPDRCPECGTVPMKL